MSSQRGNVDRSRPQRHQNAVVYKNDKYDSSSRTKKINSKQHDGVCQHCKDVLEWRVKFNKYKPLSQPKKCVKCLQKTVKDAYHIICKSCAIQLELCAKCGKKDDIVLPIQKVSEDSKNQCSNSNHENPSHCSEEIDSDLHFDIDLYSSSDDEFKDGKKQQIFKQSSKKNFSAGS